jgi:hypothetical protein
MPVVMRAYLLSNVNMCWLLGQICGVGVVRGLVKSQSQWSYRIPFGLQWVFAVPILVGVILAPESPCKYSFLKKKKKFRTIKGSNCKNRVVGSAGETR